VSLAISQWARLVPLIGTKFGGILLFGEMLTSPPPYSDPKCLRKIPILWIQAESSLISEIIDHKVIEVDYFGNLGFHVNIKNKISQE